MDTSYNMSQKIILSENGQLDMFISFDRVLLKRYMDMFMAFDRVFLKMCII